MTRRHHRNTGIIWAISGMLLIGSLSIPAIVQAQTSSPGVCTSPSTCPPPRAIPAAITQFQTRAEAMYDTLLAGNWRQATRDVNWFRGGMTRINRTVSGQAGTRRAMSYQVRQLRNAVQARNRLQALLAANALIQHATNLTAPYDPAVPVSVGRLAYHARSAQIWSRFRNRQNVREAITAMRTTWTRDVRPLVIARNGTAEARNFENSLERLRNANTIAEYRTLTSPVVRNVNDLERVFLRR